MTRKRPTTLEEYLYQIDNAVFETGDLRMSIGYDEEEQDIDMEFVANLEQALLALQKSVTEGTYIFQDHDLPFMDIVRGYGTRIPFTDLLEYINDTHRHGLEII